MKPILLEIDTGRDKLETVNINHVMRITDIGGGFSEIQFSDGGRQHVKWEYAECRKKFEDAVNNA